MGELLVKNSLDKKRVISLIDWLEKEKQEAEEKRKAFGHVSEGEANIWYPIGEEESYDCILATVNEVSNSGKRDIGESDLRAILEYAEQKYKKASAEASTSDSGCEMQCCLGRANGFFVVKTKLEHLLKDVI